MTPFSITWTHAIGRGPMGVCFVKDLTHQGYDYYVHTDHLGTPFGWYNPHTGTTTYTPFNPWGELLAISPTRGPPYATGNVDLPAGIELPTDPIFGFPPLGLSGHIYDAGTGLHQMHHRYYHPRLGHFLTPDFRAPDIWDPSTVKEPYSAFRGNPVMFWDPDGLRPSNAVEFGWATIQVISGIVAGLTWDNVASVPEFVGFLSHYQALRHKVWMNSRRMSAPDLEFERTVVAEYEAINEAFAALFEKGPLQEALKGISDDWQTASELYAQGRYFSAGRKSAAVADVIFALINLAKAGVKISQLTRREIDNVLASVGKNVKKDIPDLDLDLFPESMIDDLAGAGVPYEHWLKYYNYINNPTKGNLSADKWYKMAQTIWENRRSGNDFEDFVKFTLGNTGKKTPIEVGGATFIPDLPVGLQYGVTDVKNWLKVSRNTQLDAFYRFAKSEGLPFNLIVSSRTENVSQAIISYIRTTRGRLFVFDEQVNRFVEIDVRMLTGGWSRP